MIGEAAGVAGEPFGCLGAERPGAFEERRCVVAEVHDQGGGGALDAAVGAAVRGERDERVGGGLLPVEARAGVLVGGALGFGGAPDGLLEGGALFEWQAAAERELAPAACPGHAERAPLVEHLVVLDLGRGERAGGERDRAGRLPDREACHFSVRAGRRELGGGCDLVERERAGAERVVECGQAA